MGIVEETGPDVTKVKKGDRVIVPFNIECGECYYCKNQLESQCDNSNSHSKAGAYFGYSGTFGGYPGGQAELLRVPHGNFTPYVVPKECDLKDESILFLSDIIPTAYWCVEQSNVKNK
ncbi:S-(hydroxymethyl)glutathione dehydrogenase / alcohol dehydrogenase [Alteribacillus bidgolensis]|uniref:S-(Hydroxymethyl)glutathione dehydrogenase / alcohol dehydrogenase n=1 Tax=Alteribacillus bidgolensis TaxID=930129 RepID=A0A1G8CJK1_9BACI|nr:alcohol dehydrogenase catalytic domain-containing protein [Alteribacillus bidgolensis]SDH45070.1 S-(hydroxymethyl)glutathione dehydrogenase / alcohol dehydrogenase [Alteribacillus bidgolensis]